MDSAEMYAAKADQCIKEAKKKLKGISIYIQAPSSEI
jgi:hypothetical protein